MTNTVKLQISDDDSDTIVIRGGIKVAFNRGGGLTVYTNGDVKVNPAVNDDARPKVMADRRGDTMEDGTIFAGISPDTGRPMYTPPADAPLTLKWNAATKYAAALDAHSHRDWKLPSKAELNVLFENRAKIGGFNGSGSFLAGYYWSSSEDSSTSAWNQSFSDGHQDFSLYKYNGLSVRCVRG
jgi:hypothetical protein